MKYILEAQTERVVRFVNRKYQERTKLLDKQVLLCGAKDHNLPCNSLVLCFLSALAL